MLRSKKLNNVKSDERTYEHNLFALMHVASPTTLATSSANGFDFVDFCAVLLSILVDNDMMSDNCTTETFPFFHETLLFALLPQPKSRLNGFRDLKNFRPKSSSLLD